MQCLEELFLKSKGRPVEYKGCIIKMVDHVKVSAEQRLGIRFETVNSSWRQGIHLSTEGEFLVNNKALKNSVVIWQDTAPDEIRVVIKTKKNEVIVKNVWDTGDGTIHSWHGGAAMIVEQNETVRRYKCNDGRCDDDFDDLIFSICTVD